MATGLSVEDCLVSPLLNKMNLFFYFTVFDQISALSRISAPLQLISSLEHEI